MDPRFWAGKRVLVTGHTGFKGGWLSLWLRALGADVSGFALPPPTDPNLFEAAGVAKVLTHHVIGDVRDAAAVRSTVDRVRPDVVLHLAAQPLVRQSYADPVETYATNVMGTINVLEAVRQTGGVQAIVSVTTDKCYENREWHWGYREDEALGGHDPYSSSKACAELVTAAYRSSFNRAGEPWIGSARAGNVIGGGDWARDRLLPDVLRSLDENEIVRIRNPGSTRPWQHVLEPLAGYIQLAERLVQDGDAFAAAWNFGPSDDDAQPVGWILDRLAALEPALRWERADGEQVHEAGFLKLDSSRAKALIGWQPRWRLPTALAHTLEWHRAWRRGADMAAVCLGQIDDYAACVGD